LVLRLLNSAVSNAKLLCVKWDEKTIMHGKMERTRKNGHRKFQGIIPAFTTEEETPTSIRKANTETTYLPNTK